MATPLEHHYGLTGRGGKRARLTLDIDSQLHLQLKIAAAQAHLSMRKFTERLLENALLTPASTEGHHPATQEGLNRLLEARAAIMRGRHFTDDSTDLLHEAREERLNQL